MGMLILKLYFPCSVFLELLGHGEYGKVKKCQDTNTKEVNLYNLFGSYNNTMHVLVCYKHDIPILLGLRMQNHAKVSVKKEKSRALRKRITERSQGDCSLEKVVTSKCFAVHRSN